MLTHLRGCVANIDIFKGSSTYIIHNNITLYIWKSYGSVYFSVITTLIYQQHIFQNDLHATLHRKLSTINEPSMTAVIYLTYVFIYIYDCSVFIIVPLSPNSIHQRCILIPSHVIGMTYISSMDQSLYACHLD